MESLRSISARLCASLAITLASGFMGTLVIAHCVTMLFACLYMLLLTFIALYSFSVWSRYTNRSTGIAHTTLRPTRISWVSMSSTVTRRPYPVHSLGVHVPLSSVDIWCASFLEKLSIQMVCAFSLIFLCYVRLMFVHALNVWWIDDSYRIPTAWCSSACFSMVSYVVILIVKPKWDSSCRPFLDRPW